MTSTLFLLQKGGKKATGMTDILFFVPFLENKNWDME